MNKIFRGFHIFLFRLHLLGLRHSKLVLVFFSLFFIWGLSAASNLKFLISIDDLIDPDFKSFSVMQKNKQEFKDQNNLVLILNNRKNRFTKTEICDLKVTLQNFKDSTQVVSRISSSFGVRPPVWKNQNLQFPDFFDVNCFSADTKDEHIITEGFKKLHESPWNNILISKYKNDLTISFYIRDKENLNVGKFDINDVTEVQDYFQKNFLNLHPNIQPIWSGTAAYQYHLKKAYDQTQALNGLMLILALLFFKWFFNSWKAGFLFNWSILVTTVPLYGLMAYIGTPIDSLTNAIPLMLVISCLEDFVFFVFLLAKRPGQWKWALRKVVIPCFYTSLTTAIGFGALGLSDLSLISRFGIWSAFAGILEWAVIFIYIPALFITIKRTQINHIAFRSSFARAIKAIKSMKLPKTLAYISLICFPIALLGLNSLQVADSPNEMFKQAHIVRQTSELISSLRGWNAETSLVFNDNDELFNRNIIKSLSQHSIVAEIEDPFTVQDYIGKGLLEHQSRFVKSLWKSSVYSKRLISDSGETRAIVYLKSTDLADLKKLQQYVDAKLCPQNQCHLTSSLMSYVEFGERVLSTLMESLLGSLIIISIILFLLGRFMKVTNITAAIVSAMWGPVAVISLFVVFKIPIFYVTSICASVLVGLAGDNTIQFIFARKKNLQKGIEEFAPASFLISMGMSFLCLVFLFSVFQPLTKLGLIMMGGFLLILFGDIFILKGLLKNESPKPGN